MPRWLRNFLFERDLKNHLLIALGVGALLRICSAIFVYGPQALDDYKHGVWPAYQYFAGETLTLPEYRSHLLTWVLSSFIEVGALFGVSSAQGQVRAMYLGLAALSLLGIWGTYLYASTLRSRVAGALALYLVAFFPVMPFVSTRAFGEAIAMSLVLLAFGLLESARHKSARWPQWLVGFMILGLATLFRFHAGILFCFYLGIIIILRFPQGILGGLLGGLFTLGAQAVVDLASGKPALGTLFTYLAVNEGGAAKYGVSPWYNPWLFVLGVTLAPFSFVFIKSLKGLWRKQWTILIPLLVFVAAHSLVPHKEDRFLYPILGLILWAVAYLWSANAFNRWAKRIYTPVSIGLTLLVLPVVCFVNTQEGEIEPPAYVERRYKDVVYLDYKSLFGQSRFQFFFLRPPSTLKPVEAQDFNLEQIDAALNLERQPEAAVLITSEPEAGVQLSSLSGATTAEAHCQSVREAGSVIDRMLFRLNAKHNQRRRPTWYLICERKKNAG